MAKNEAIPELFAVLAQYLDCPCQYFPPAKHDKPIMTAYREARERGKRNGFVPMLIPANETLWEMLMINACGGEGQGLLQFDPEKVARYRKDALAAPLQDGREFFQDLERTRMEGILDEGYLEEIMGESSVKTVPSRSFYGHLDHFAKKTLFSKKTLPLLLAEIPAKQPWEVFAWLPFGGWNECPDTPVLMSVSKYWFEEYGAVPALVTQDILEFSLPSSVGKARAEQLAKEQYFWCPDIVDQGIGSVKALANQLEDSTVWFFWWD